MVQMSGLVKKKGGKKGALFGIATAVFAQVENNCVDIGEEIHGGDGRGSTNVGIAEKAEFQIADIAGKMFDFFKAAIHFFHLLALLRDFFGVGFCIGGAFGHFDGAVIHVQVLVVADGLKIVGEFGRERVAVVDGVVVAMLLVSAHGVFHFFGRVGEYVELVEIFDGAVDDAGARGGVNFESDVGKICVGRKRLEPEAGDFGGIGVFDVEIADRFGGAVALFDEEFDVEAFTF